MFSLNSTDLIKIETSALKQSMVPLMILEIIKMLIAKAIKDTPDND